MGARRTVKIILPWLILAISTILLLVGLFFIFTPVDSGMIVFDDNNSSEIKEILKLFLDIFSDLIKFIVGAFGVVAFLVTYQVKVGATITSKAWGLLSTGIVMLSGALVFCFLGREQLLIMTARNAIDFTLAALKYARWFSYICLSAFAILIGFYAVEVATAPKRQGSSKED